SIYTLTAVAALIYFSAYVIYQVYCMLYPTIPIIMRNIPRTWNTRRQTPIFQICKANLSLTVCSSSISSYPRTISQQDLRSRIPSQILQQPGMAEGLGAI